MDDPESISPTKPIENQAQQPSTSGTANVKRRLPDASDPEAPAAKTANRETQQAQPIAPKTGTPGTSSTSAAEPMQIDNPSGNDPNTGGTLQGESGTRKEQAPRGKVFGLLKVSDTMSTNTNKKTSNYLCVYKTKDEATNFMDMIDMCWKQVDIYNVKFEYNDTTYFAIYLTLPFNISWTTLKLRLGLSLTDAHYIANRPIECDTEDIDSIRNSIVRCYSLLIKNQIPSVNVDNMIEQEEKRKSNWNHNEPSAKKPRLAW